MFVGVTWQIENYKMCWKIAENRNSTTKTSDVTTLWVPNYVEAFCKLNFLSQQFGLSLINEIWQFSNAIKSTLVNPLITYSLYWQIP